MKDRLPWTALKYPQNFNHKNKIDLKALKLIPKMESDKTQVIGCLMNISDLCFVRIETAIISIAFDSAEDIILYTRAIDPSEQARGLVRDISQDKFLLKKLLGSLFRESSFGIHYLRGGHFEVTIPEKRNPLPTQLFEPEEFVFEDGVSTGADSWASTEIVSQDSV